MSGCDQRPLNHRRTKVQLWRLVKNRQLSPLLLIVSILIGSSLFMSCAKVPEEAVSLSIVVGNRIAVVQTSHEKFVRKYFDLARMRVEDFLVNRWIPEFLETFVQDAKLMKKLENPKPFEQAEIDQLREELQRVVQARKLNQAVSAVESALGDSERGKITLEFAEAALEEIQAQRTELIQPLNQLETTAVAEIRGAYAELIQMQSSVTAFVKSVRKVNVEQDAILQRLGLLKARDQAVDRVISLNDRIVSLTQQAGTAKEIIAKIKNEVGTATSNSGSGANQ